MSDEKLYDGPEVAPLQRFHVHAAVLDLEDSFSLSFEIWSPSKELALEDARKKVDEATREEYKTRVVLTIRDDEGTKHYNELRLQP